ncbi:MAG: hypothetical protein IIU28_08915 [Lachnospiraceae bacterium]|nr:hypothetical protein [Lachnospiraceae bacterium]
MKQVFVQKREGCFIMNKMKKGTKKIGLYVIMIGMIITERVIHPELLSLLVCVVGVVMFLAAIALEYYKMKRETEGMKR